MKKNILHWVLDLLTLTEKSILLDRKYLAIFVQALIVVYLSLFAVYLVTPPNYQKKDIHLSVKLLKVIITENQGVLKYTLELPA